MQIVVTMEKMLCAKPDNRWYFFRGLMGGNGEPEQTVICKGSMAWNPGEKETLALIGDWTLYKGERHFQFKSAKLTLPLEPRSQLHYVCQRTSGIGCTLEQQIWDARKEDWRNLERGEIKKMNDLVYDLFMDEIVNFDANSEKTEIISWLLNKGCTENMAAAAFEAWGKDTPGIVNANCYRLADLSGYSFKTVDENIRRHFEIGDHDPRRIKSAVIYAMQLETEDGSTAINCWRHFAACHKDAGYLILSLGGIDAVRAKLISEEEYEKIKADRKVAAEAREAAAEAKEDRLDAILADTNSTAKEILAATIAALNSENGWFIADKVFGGENALTAALLNFGGSFTFTPFDNGEIVIKFDNGSRYSTSRKSHLQNTGRIAEII